MRNPGQINRRHFLRQTAAFGAGLGLLPSGCWANNKTGGNRVKKPNILFIPVDDLRIQLGCYGHTETISPNIDRLGAEGTVFKRAYCQVPVCGPSRVSVMTGIRTNNNQWSTKSLGRSFKSMPKHFKENGYHTISNGKVYHTMADDKDSWSEEPWRSVEVYYGKGDWAGYNKYGQWQNAESAELVNKKSGRGPFCESADVPDNAYQDGKVAEKTIADLRKCKDMDKPFFIACGFWRPHLPFNAPKKYWDMYDRDKIELADNRYKPKDLPKECRNSSEINRYGEVAGRKSTDDFHKQARHGYYACVSYVDAQIGKVLNELERLGLADNTIVILWGDHGWHLGEHDFWGKHNTLNNALHAPMIIRAPGFKQNNKTNALVEFVDMYPSLCELAGVGVPEKQLAGKSFVPLMGDPNLPWKKAVFSRFGGKAVKTDRYLYTEWKNSRMLFDHKTDPDENVNIAELPENAEIVSRLSELLNK